MFNFFHKNHFPTAASVRKSMDNTIPEELLNDISNQIFAAAAEGKTSICYDVPEKYYTVLRNFLDKHNYFVTKVIKLPNNLITIDIDWEQ